MVFVTRLCRFAVSSFYEKLKDAIGADQVQLDLLPECEHADEKLFDAQNVAKVYDFVDQYLK